MDRIILRGVRLRGNKWNERNEYDEILKAMKEMGINGVLMIIS